MHTFYRFVYLLTAYYSAGWLSPPDSETRYLVTDRKQSKSVKQLAVLYGLWAICRRLPEGTEERHEGW